MTPIIFIHIKTTELVWCEIEILSFQSFRLAYIIRPEAPMSIETPMK